MSRAGIPRRKKITAAVIALHAIAAAACFM